MKRIGYLFAIFFVLGVSSCQVESEPDQIDTEVPIDQPNISQSVFRPYLLELNIDGFESLSSVDKKIAILSSVEKITNDTQIAIVVVSSYQFVPAILIQMNQEDLASLRKHKHPLIESIIVNNVSSANID